VPTFFERKSKKLLKKPHKCVIMYHSKADTRVISILSKNGEKKK